MAFNLGVDAEVRENDSVASSQARNCVYYRIELAFGLMGYTGAIHDVVVKSRDLL